MPRSRQKIQHDFGEFLRRLLEHRMRGVRDHHRVRIGHMRGQRMQHLRQQAVGAFAPDEQCRHFDRLGVGLRKWWTIIAHLADQGGRIVAQALFHQFRQPLPVALALQRVDEIFEPALDIAGRDLVRRHRESGKQRRGAALVIGIERGIDLAAGFGKDQLAQQIGPPLRDTKRNVSAAGMAHQVDRAVTDLLDENDEIVDMLRDRVGATLAVPVIGKEMAQADANQAMLCRQRADHATPDAEVVQRTMHADQRRSLCMTYVEIGHVISVDVKGLHGGSGGAGGWNQLRKIPGIRVDRNTFQA